MEKIFTALQHLENAITTLAYYLPSQEDKYAVEESIEKYRKVISDIRRSENLDRNDFLNHIKKQKTMKRTILLTMLLLASFFGAMATPTEPVTYKYEDGFSLVVDVQSHDYILVAAYQNGVFLFNATLTHEGADIITETYNRTPLESCMNAQWYNCIRSGLNCDCYDSNVTYAACTFAFIAKCYKQHGASILN